MIHSLPPVQHVGKQSAHCTATRAAHDSTVHSMAHHHCVVGGQPHPTHPHVCACGTEWPQVGYVTCGLCGTTRDYRDLESSPLLGIPTYRCLSSCTPVDVGEFAPIVLDAARMIHATLGHEPRLLSSCARCRDSARVALGVLAVAFPDGHNRVEGDSPDTPGSAVATPTPRYGDPPTVRVAAARGILASLLDVIEQNDQADPPPWGVITNGIGRVERELARVAAAIAPEPAHIRRPGDHPGHGDVTT